MDGPRHRRDFLRLSTLALGSSFAGCAWNNGPSTGMTRTADTESETTTREPTETRTSSETPTSTTDPDKSVLDLTADDVSFDVAVTRQFSKEHPARIRATFTNESDMLFRLTGGTTLPISGYSVPDSRDGNSLYLLADDRGHLLDLDAGEPIGDDYLPETAETGCWTLPTRVAVAGVSRRTDLRPGEAVAMGFTVLGDHGTDGCLTAGSFPVSEVVMIGESPVAFHALGLELWFALVLDADRSLTVEGEDAAVVGTYSHGSTTARNRTIRQPNIPVDR